MKRGFLFLPLLVLAFAVHPGAAHAASLSVVPDATTVSAGDTFGATVYLDSAGTAINASDGTLSFSPDMLEAQSIAYGNSIFTLWAQEPSIDNGNGTVSWSGGSTSAFSGSHGRVLRVAFLAKKTGVVALSLSSSSIYADDGTGTNVATAPSPASVTITSAAAVPAPAASAPAVSAAGSGLTIAISSPTDPSQDAWYATTSAALAWSVSSSVDAVETLVSAKEGAIPTVLYRPAITQKTIDSLTDGVWYFNLRAHTASGWGPVSSYRLQIDTVPPVFSAASAVYDATSSALSVFASASDGGSGVQSYALLIDDAPSTTFKPADVADGSYRVPVSLGAGTHTARIRAIDGAGNMADSKEFAFTVAAPAQKPAPVLAWLSSLGAGSIALFLALLLSFFSIGMNVILWMRVRVHERRIVSGLDVRKIRSLTVNQLAVIEKEVVREIRVLDRARSRHDITAEEADEIGQMRRRLIEIGTFIEKQVKAIEER